jgi:hypothetical protein
MAKHKAGTKTDKKKVGNTVAKPKGLFNWLGNAINIMAKPDSIKKKNRARAMGD